MLEDNSAEEVLGLCNLKGYLCTLGLEPSMRSPWFFLAWGFCVRRDNDVGIGFDLAWLLNG